MIQVLKGGRSILLGLCLASGLTTGAGAATPGAKSKELTPAELIRLAQRKTFSPEDRTDAIKKLSQLTPSQLVRDFRVVETALLLVQDKDDDMFVRIAAIAALGELQARLFTEGFKNQYIQPFIQLVKNADESVFVREAVLDTFRKTLVNDDKQIKDKEAFDALCALAESDDKGPKGVPPLIRSKCIEAIGEFGSERGIEALASILGQVNLEPQIREAAVIALANLLGNIKDVESVKVPTINRLIEYVVSKDCPIDIRSEGLKALARLHAQGARGIMPRLLEILTKILNEVGDHTVYMACIQALGILGEESAVAVLDKTYTLSIGLDIHDDKDVKIRREAMKTLGYILAAQNLKRGGANAAAVKQIVDLLLKAIENQDAIKEVPSVVNSAIFALRYLHPKKSPFQEHHRRAIDKLIDLLRPPKKNEAPNPEQLDQTMETLKFLTELPYKTPARWNRWYDEKFGHPVKP